VADVEQGGAGLTVTVGEVAGEPGVATFTVSGQLDVSTEAELRDALAGAVSQKPAKIVLDVSGLEFMDSSGLAVLLVAAREVDAVELANPTAIIRRLIGAAGLSETLRMTPDA
jgi:anti-anti-sigma factor